ncbi:unnamed protein product [Schistosoma margrebowiei]|uniref:Uncharacterized protein n=1 Tax=Schistosoma margrebowiei TaxID=48269 RepID=A0A183LVC7_9TREM|nr:unnamed protein product [Schistosoma margrebowiei]
MTTTSVAAVSASVGVNIHEGKGKILNTTRRTPIQPHLMEKFSGIGGSGADVKNLELTTSSDIQSNEPPKKTLLSCGSRLTKISSEKSVSENPSKNTNFTTNNDHLLVISDNSERESIKNLIHQHKSRHSYIINNNNNNAKKKKKKKKSRKNENSTPIKARPVLLKRSS